MSDPVAFALVGLPVWCLLGVVLWKAAGWALAVADARRYARELDRSSFPVKLTTVPSGREMWLHRCWSCGEPFWADERETLDGCDICSPGGA